MSIEYAVAPDPTDDEVQPKDGMIKVIDETYGTKVVCEISTRKTARQKIQIEY